jgi:hypothetical protein
MAPGGSGGTRIARTWTEMDAPTCEGDRYETEDGRIWKRTYDRNPLGTGDERGRIVGDRIMPKAKP